MVHNNHVIEPLFGEGNFIGVNLLSDLQVEKKYNVEFYLSLMDSARFAGRNVGAYFSNGQPNNDIGQLLSLEPQVRYVGDFLIDKEGWMRIAGTFIAEGGENYITIGNFDGYFNSDTLNLHEGGVVDGTGVYDPGYWELAVYFVDDVSVIADTSYHVGVNEHLAIDNQQLSFYPNPTTDVLTIEVALNEDRAFELLDMQGRVVLRQGMQAEKQNVDVSQLPNGVYVAVLRQKGVAVARRKVVIQR